MSYKKKSKSHFQHKHHMICFPKLPHLFFIGNTEIVLCVHVCFGQVMITLEGTNGESDTHHLAYPDQPAFEKGGVDMFMLSTPFSLGELEHIKLWHDNTGGDPDW